MNGVLISGTLRYWFSDSKHIAVEAVEYGLEADNLLKLKISDSWPTRINLKDEKINEIFIYPQNVTEVIVYESGYLFIAS